jgi:DtxR family Mn-dependent transcriptional regulator
VESIADSLRISPARASELVNKMLQAGLVSVDDGRLALTGEGARYALDVVRAHRLWERYLADETGVDPLEWHARAERKEHALSREAADALSERLGHPRFDPHGDPIPTADGALPAVPQATLADLDAGERATITHIEDEPAVVYSQLLALGLHPGMDVRMDARAGQRLVFEAEGRKVVLAPPVAESVSVRRLLPGEAAEDDTGATTLAALSPGETAEVVRVSRACRGLERRRLMDLGIVTGTRVEFERRGPTGGLCAYRVRGTTIALREEQTRMIIVAPAGAEGVARGGGKG